MGSGASRTVTVRPAFDRVMRPASSSTSRCFITAGSLIANGFASSLTESAVLAFEPGEDRPPRRVDERRKGPVQPLLIVHHVVKYWR